MISTKLDLSDGLSDKHIEINLMQHSEIDDEGEGRSIFLPAILALKF